MSSPRLRRATLSVLVLSIALIVPPVAFGAGDVTNKIDEWILRVE